MAAIKHLPDGELEIMQIIWHADRAVSRTDVEHELGKSKSLAPTTILTFLTRLCDKGFLKVERVERSNYYTPLVTERAYLASESRSILNKLYGGSLSAFAVSLSDSGVSREELEQLRQMLEEGSL